MKTSSEAQLRAYRLFRRWAGLPIILGGVAIGFSGVSHTLGAILTTIGLAVIGLRPYGIARRMSLAGWVLTLIGAWAIFIVDFLRWSSSTLLVTSPILANYGSLAGGLILLAGYFLIGLALALSREHTSAGLALAITPFTVVFLGDLGAIALGLTLIWLGFALLFEREKEQVDLENL